MKLFTALASLFLAGSLTLGLPTPSEYSQLAPSERAAIDATKLIVYYSPNFQERHSSNILKCSQYPNRDWIMIGTQKFDCPSAQKGKRETDGDMSTNVDNYWIVEYRVI
jgi:hypothetical protein